MAATPTARALRAGIVTHKELVDIGWRRALGESSVPVTSNASDLSDRERVQEIMDTGFDEQEQILALLLWKHKYADREARHRSRPPLAYRGAKARAGHAHHRDQGTRDRASGDDPAARGHAGHQCTAIYGRLCSTTGDALFHALRRDLDERAMGGLMPHHPAASDHYEMSTWLEGARDRADRRPRRVDVVAVSAPPASLCRNSRHGALHEPPLSGPAGCVHARRVRRGRPPNAGPPYMRTISPSNGPPPRSWPTPTPGEPGKASKPKKLGTEDLTRRGPYRNNAGEAITVTRENWVPLGGCEGHLFLAHGGALGGAIGGDKLTHDPHACGPYYEIRQGTHGRLIGTTQCIDWWVSRLIDLYSPARKGGGHHA